MIDKESSSVQVRVYLLGDVYVERRTPEGSWEGVPSDSEEWGPGTYARALLRYLLCNGRRVGRGTIMDTLWPEVDSAERYLNNAASTLRRVLRSPEPGGLLETVYSRTAYRLAGQGRLWVDYEHCEAVLAEAGRVGHTSVQGLALLKEAEGYLRRGPFLADELGDWCLGQRENVRTVYYRCRLWLAEAYEVQQEMWQAEKVVAGLLGEDPTDESALYRLMSLLHRQGLTAEALRRCQQVAALLGREGLTLSGETEMLAKQLQSRPRIMVQAASLLVVPSSTDIHEVGAPGKRDTQEGCTPSPVCDLPLSPPTSQQLTRMLPSSMYVKIGGEEEPVVEYQRDGSFIPLENGVFVPISHFLSAHSSKEAAVDAGTRLSEVLTYIFAQVHLWQTHSWPCHDLHRLLDMELNMFDEIKPQSDPAEYHTSRRNALLALAALPTGLLEVIQSHQQRVPPEELLPACTASLAACWRLMAGREFEAIERAVTAYQPHLLGWAQHSAPHHRPTALSLAAQGYLLLGIIALYRLPIPNNFQARQAYCQHAVEFARESGDRSLLIIALTHVANAHHAMGQSTELQAYQEAESLLTEETSPLLRSRVFADASRAYARSGHVEEALRRISEVRVIYPGMVADAPGFLAADSGPVEMILYEGQSYLALGHHESATDYYATAEKTFAGIARLPTTMVLPERFLAWVANEQAFTAIKVKNLDDFERYFIQGVQAAEALGSQERRREAIANWKEARKVWPDEKRMLQLADQFR